MKKILFFTVIVATALLSSCKKDEIGGTATESMAGDWYVTVDAVDDNGSVVGEDFFGLGRIHLLTFNTSENVANKLYVYDEGNFWNFKVVADCDVNGLTFTTNGERTSEIQGQDSDTKQYYDYTVNISGGKIMQQAGRQNNGSPADSIVFYVTFSDDVYPAHYGYAKYKVSGIRYSGLAEND